MKYAEEIEELKKTMRMTAENILSRGHEIHPNLHLILMPQDIIIPTVVSWESTEEKHLYFDAFRRMIDALQPTIIAFSCEAWMTRKKAGGWFLLAPSEDPQKEDTYFQLIRTADYSEIGSCPITTTGKRRTLGTMEWNQLDATGPLAEIFNRI